MPETWSSSISISSHSNVYHSDPRLRDTAQLGMKLAIATVSLGRASAGHSLIGKLRAASEAGIQGIEIFWECFVDYADRNTKHGSKEERWTLAAQQLRAECDTLTLEIIALQPFVEFDGLVDTSSRLEDAAVWLSLMKTMGASYLQVPANFVAVDDERFANTAAADGDAIIIRNLQELADMAAREAPGVVIAYEPMAWSTYVDSWRHALTITRAVNRPNVRLCLDTFHVAGREWGDPTAKDGRAESCSLFAGSVEDLAKNMTKADIGYVQLSDATLMAPPLPDNKLTDTSQRPRMNWSRTSRTFPYMDGYLPLEGLIDAIAKIGFDGWYSMETFNISLFDREPDVPQNEARRAMESFKRVQEKHFM